MLAQPRNRRPGPPTLLAHQVDDERRIEVDHSFGARAGDLRRFLICRSTPSSVLSLIVIRCVTRRRSAPVPPLNCFLITSENDSPGPLRRASASYAAMSIVMVLT